MNLGEFADTPRTRVRRLPERGSQSRADAYPIIDEALYCHLGFLRGGSPAVIPTIHARDDDDLIVHGSPASSMLRAIKGGVEVCVAITLLDGIVLARSAFHSSLNYRSVVVYGRATEIEDRAGKLRAMEVLTEHVAAGRWADARPVTDSELRATTMLRIPLDEASVKIRTGPPHDDEADLELSIWAGVVPAGTSWGEPERDDSVPADVALPPYLDPYTRG